MHLLEFVSLFVVAFIVCVVRGDEADVQIVSSGYCSNEILKSKGVDVNKFKNKIIFDPKKIKTIPAKPTVPGCFRLVARNVTLLDKLNQATAEFEMRVAGNADPSKPVLQCKKKQPKCGCGEKDTCMYCDFCKNFKKFVQEGKVNNKEINIDAAGPATCNCNVQPDRYDIDVEVCTPDEDEMAQNLPTEVLDSVSEGRSFSLFTTLMIYDFRFNSLSNSDDSAAAKEALKKRKAKGMAACYIIGTNIST